MNLKRIILLITFFVSAIVWGQSEKDIIVVDSVSFKNLQKTDVSGVGGPVLKMEVTLLPKRPDPTTPASKWLRNIEVDVMVAYEDAKDPSKSKYFLLHSRAKIFAAKVGQKTPVSFYIPWEAYEVYGVKGEPYMYKVGISQNGTEIPLTGKNIKDRLSKNITSMDLLEKFEKAVSSAANEGVLKPVNECAVNIQLYEYNSVKIVPTYLNLK